MAPAPPGFDLSPVTLRDVGLPDVTLRVASAGPEDGRPTILPHGLPEFWFGWRHQIAPIAGWGPHVVVPDQRGYNLSSKPGPLAADHLARTAGSPGFRKPRTGCITRSRNRSTPPWRSSWGPISRVSDLSKNVPMVDGARRFG